MENTYLGGILDRVLKSVENGNKTYAELTKDGKSFVKVSNGKIRLAFDLSYSTDVEILQTLIRDDFEVSPRVNISTPKKSDQTTQADVSNSEGLGKVSEAHCKDYTGKF